MNNEFGLSRSNSVQQRVPKIIKGTATIDDRFVPDYEELDILIELLRSMGCIIVFTTGVWDLFHIGHPEYIQLGKEKATELYPQGTTVIMVVGVDTDDLTRRRKGPSRPIVPQDERVRVLGHVRSVDILTLQYEADQLFKRVKHDVRVISTSTDDLPDLEKIKEQCEYIVNLPPQAETSTTARVRRLTMEGSISTLKRVEEALTNALAEVRDGIKS